MKGDMMMVVWISDNHYVLENYYNLKLPKDWYWCETSKLYWNRLSNHKLQVTEHQPDNSYCTTVIQIN